METKIYFLTSDLDNNLPMYVGKTVKNLNDRLSQHVYDANHRKEKNKKDTWIRKRISQNEKIKIQVIDIVYENWEYWEKYYILKYSKIYDLKNHSLGGEGAPGNKHSEETRKLISLKLKGRKCSPEHIENIKKCRLGWIFSKETIEKIRISNTGKKLSDETKLKISNSKKGTISKNKVKIKQFSKDMIFIKEWDSIEEAAQNLKLQRPNIIKVLKKNRKSAGNFYFEYSSGSKTL